MRIMLKTNFEVYLRKEKSRKTFTNLDKKLPLKLLKKKSEGTEQEKS